MVGAVACCPTKALTHWGMMVHMHLVKTYAPHIVHDRREGLVHQVLDVGVADCHEPGVQVGGHVLSHEVGTAYVNQWAGSVGVVLKVILDGTACACTKLYNISGGFGSRASRGVCGDISRSVCTVSKLV